MQLGKTKMVIIKQKCVYKQNLDLHLDFNSNLHSSLKKDGFPSYCITLGFNASSVYFGVYLSPWPPFPYVFLIPRLNIISH